MNTTPSGRSRLQRFLQAGSEELETTLHATTDLPARLSATLTPRTPGTQDTPDPSSPLTRALRNGDHELRHALTRSTDTEQHLAATLHRIPGTHGTATHGTATPLPPFPGEHHIA
ncbi:hypothetical protein OIU91_30870 [Streptomyces sp. NBC_01456]|uniref:hypothetical protein n=1 Tax=unclassified Streptomyces TaxID=2593676 RepID=UPI002E34BC13|nr:MULTISPECIES: hypothetical protein [unclassified Streptomyces]